MAEAKLRPMEVNAQALSAIRTALKSQYHASLAMLREAVEKCPDDLWYSKEYKNACWQLAYHTLFFTHLYMQPHFSDYKPWEHQQSDVQFPDCFPNMEEAQGTLPLIPDSYTREQVLEYLSFCDRMVDETVDRQELFDSECGFHWYKMPKFEHQMMNLRHIQHGAAQLADRLRYKLDSSIDWVGKQRG